MPEHDEGRPRTGPASQVSNLAAPIVAVAVVVHVDLTREPDTTRDHDLHALYRLEGTPAGARVIVSVGRRQWVPATTARELHRIAQRFQVELHGTADANLHRWRTAALTGRDGVIL